MSLDLDALEKTAREATPGPWEAHIEQYSSEGGDYYGGHIPGVAEVVSDYYIGDRPPFDPDDAEHIAAFDPPTALVLIAEIRKLRAEIERWGGYYRIQRNAADELEAERDTMQAKLDRVRELAEADYRCPCCTGYESILEAIGETDE